MQGVLRMVFMLPNLVAAGALFLLMCMTFLDVILRSVLNAPIEVAADMTRMLVAITVFSVMPMLSLTGRHITVDLLDGVFGRLGILRVLNALIALGCGVMLIWPAQRVWVLAERSRSYGDVMEYLGLPLHYVGWFICVMTWITAGALVLRGLGLLFAPARMEALT